MFSFEFHETFKNTFLTEDLWTTASVDILCFFCGYALGKVRQSFSPSATDFDSEIFSYLEKG